MEKMLKEVLEKITPTEKEKEKEKKLKEKIFKEIKKIEGKHVDVVHCGSAARNTDLRGSKDIDIFVLFQEKLSREEFEREGLRIGKEVFRNHEWEKAFAEHPYIRGHISGFAIDIVPSYKVRKAELLQSAVDRSPFHQKYLEERLSKGLKQEVRLFRAFLKGIKAYGAKLKFSSMPGYAVELIVLRYGGFLHSLKAVSKWKVGEILDLEGHWKGKEKECKKKFGEHHLIIVDPTDKNRNVASALSYNQFARIIAASRAFLKKPNKNFFFGKKVRVWDKKRVKKAFKEKEIVLMKIPYPKKALADIIYGQIKHFTKKVEKQLQLNDFIVKNFAEWTDEKTLIGIVFELEALELERVKKQLGPEVIDEKNSEIFLKQAGIVGGARIEKGRWVIEKKRRYWKAEEFLKNELKKAKEKNPLQKGIRKGKVLNEREILNLYGKNKEFAGFLTLFLKGKEEFLEY